MSQLSVYEVVGRRGETGPVSFSYLGIEAGLIYVVPFVRNGLIREDLKVTRQGKVAVEDAAAFLAECQSDLCILAADRETVLELYDPAEHVLMPFRIHQIVHASRGWEEVTRRMSARELKRYQKLAARNAFAYRISHEDADFFRFYETMHRPTMQKRHGELARSVEINTAYETLFKKGLLFQVTQDGVPVSGSVSQIDAGKNWLNTRLIGVLNGDEKYLDNGAQNFTYHAILHWACNVGGIDVVDFGGCEPFLTKGTFQHKKRFATEAILPPNQFHDVRMLLRANGRSPAVRDYLIDNPVMIVDENDNLGAGYFHDEERPPRLDIPYQCPGLDYHRLCSLSEPVLAGGREGNGQRGKEVCDSADCPRDPRATAASPASA
jgi:hypothetical protein